MVALFLTFWGTPRPISIMAYEFALSPAVRIRVSLSLWPPQLGDGHPERGEVVSQSSLNLHLSSDKRQIVMGSLCVFF